MPRMYIAMRIVTEIDASWRQTRGVAQSLPVQMAVMPRLLYHTPNALSVIKSQEFQKKS